jgi:plasmid stabilization system protein ParE
VDNHRLRPGGPTAHNRRRMRLAHACGRLGTHRSDGANSGATAGALGPSRRSIACGPATVVSTRQARRHVRAG